MTGEILQRQWLYQVRLEPYTLGLFNPICTYSYIIQCTWQLLGLAVKDPWLALGEQIPPLAEQILTLAAWTGLENTILTFYRGWFLAGKASWALIGHLPTKNVDYCMLVHSTIPCYQNLAHQLITFRTMCNISLREFHQLLGYF